MALAAFALAAAYAEEEESEKSLETAKRLLGLHQTLMAAWQQFSVQAGIDQASAGKLLNLDCSVFDNFMLDLMSEVINENVQPPQRADILKEVENLQIWWVG